MLASSLVVALLRCWLVQERVCGVVEVDMDTTAVEPGCSPHPDTRWYLKHKG